MIGDGVDLPAGATFGRYRIERLLGQGGMGAVYEVSEPSGRRFALKVLLAADEPEALRRFLREARALQAIRHPHLLDIREVLERGAPSPSGPILAPALVLELCPGGSLRDQLRARGRLPWAEAARLGAQVAHALAVLHAAGFVHRDLKPGNVLLGADGGARLADLGIVRPVGPSALSAAPALTAAGSLIGTLDSMAPEQLDGAEVDQRADLWSLGVLLHTLVTGSPPWDSVHNVIQRMERLLRQRPAALRSLVPGCPAGLEALVLRLLTVDRDARPGDARAVAFELEALLARAAPGARTRVGPMLALGAAALVLGGALAAATSSPAPPEPPAPPATEAATAPVPTATTPPPPALEPEVTPPTPLPAIEPFQVTVEVEPAPARAFTLVVTATRPIAKVHVAPHDPMTFPKVARDPPELGPAARRLRLLFTELPPAGLRVALFVTGREGESARHDELLLAAPAGLEVGPVTPVAAPRRARKEPARPTVVRTRRWPLPAGGALDLVWVPDGAGGGAFVGRTEVTWGAWLAFSAATGRAAPPRPDWASDAHPVAGVTLDEARAFCAWAGLRLPTDDELERAARGADGRRFPWGDDLPDPARAAFGGTAPGPAGGLPRGASPWGALDLVGSVWEWVEATEPAARGGGWSSLAEALAASSRRAPPPLEETGLRVAKDVGLDPRPPGSTPR